MKKKLLILFGLLSLITIINTISCTKCGDNTVYKVTDLFFEQTGVQFNSNNQHPDRLYFYDIRRDTLYYSFYGVFIEPRMQARALINPNFSSFGFINAAYACDPIPTTTNDRIKDIEITADKNFDDNHPKGSNLAEYFDIVVTYRHTKAFEIKYDLKKYLDRKPIVPNQMVLILKVKPKRDIKIAFSIKYLQDGALMNAKSIQFKSVTLTQ